MRSCIKNKKYSVFIKWQLRGVKNVLKTTLEGKQV